MKIATTTHDGREYLIDAHVDPFNEGRVIFTAWEPTAFQATGGHATITSFSGDPHPGGIWYGKVGTARWESDLPVGEARSAALEYHLRQESERARRAIYKACGDRFAFEAVQPSGLSRHELSSMDPAAVVAVAVRAKA